MTHLVQPKDTYGCTVAAVASATDVSYKDALRALFPKGRPKNEVVRIPGYGPLRVEYPGIARLDQIEKGLKRLGFRANIVQNATMDPRTRQQANWRDDPDWMDANFKRVIYPRDLKKVTILGIKRSTWMWMHCEVWDPASKRVVNPTGWAEVRDPGKAFRCVYWYAEVERLDGKAIPGFGSCTCDSCRARRAEFYRRFYAA